MKSKVYELRKDDSKLKNLSLCFHTLYLLLIFFD